MDWPEGCESMRRTTLFTCSIYPDLTRIWHHFARRYTDPSSVEIMIYDCGSRLRKEHFPDATIRRHPNVEHGKKIDHCIGSSIRTPLVFLSDDDSFILNQETEPLAAHALLSKAKAAGLSYKPRGWWTLDINGCSHPVMGSYSLVFKADVIRKEKLSFRTRPTGNPAIRNGSGYYDTADYANEQLLLRGYEVMVPEPEVRGKMVRSYAAVSNGFVNFARRRWYSKSYLLTRHRSDWSKIIQVDTRKMEWACGVAATIELYRRIFAEEPQFNDFFVYDDLEELANGVKDPSIRGQAINTVTEYRRLLAVLGEAS
jgi:hypothetical protein